MKNKIYLVAVFLSVVALLTGCVKDGPVGPRGPEGPQGPEGNANVLATNSFTVDWAFNPTYNIYTDTVLVPGITQDILDYGTVEVYIKYSNEWWVLPDIMENNSTTYGFGLGYVSLVNSNADKSVPLYPASSTFRIVFISSSLRKANPNLNWNNYEEVKTALKLQD